MIIKSAEHKDKKGVINGYSCIDIFDFDEKEIKLISYQYEPGLGYY